jgi:hypothetical protein
VPDDRLRLLTLQWADGEHGDDRAAEEDRGADVEGAVVAVDELRGKAWVGEVRDEDLPVLFDQWADPVAGQMAAFTAPDHMDRDAFERR